MSKLDNSWTKNYSETKFKYVYVEDIKTIKIVCILLSNDKTVQYSRETRLNLECPNKINKKEIMDHCATIFPKCEFWKLSNLALYNIHISRDENISAINYADFFKFYDRVPDELILTPTVEFLHDENALYVFAHKELDAKKGGGITRRHLLTAIKKTRRKRA